VAAYISLCDIDSLSFHNLFPSDTHTIDLLTPVQTISFPTIQTLLAIYAGKKYKPVAIKVRPVETKLPSRFHIMHDIKGNLLKDMLVLMTQPPPYTPTSWYTKEHKDIIEHAHPGDFLLLEEHALMHHFMCAQNLGFAWYDLEHGHFHKDFFPPIEILTIPYKPWAQQNIPIPPSIYEEVCQIIRNKLDAGVYKPSNSSYRLRWFCMVKKDGKLLQIVHSLELLNQVTIKHAGVTPFTNQIGKHFTGRACSGMLDLYVGYDEHGLSSTSRDLTTFQSLFGLLCLVTLLMGWTNSIPIFHDDITHIL